MNETEMLTPKQVAEKLKVNYRTILSRIERGEIKTIRIGKNFFVTPSAIEEYLDNSMAVQPLRIAVALVMHENQILLVKRKTKEGKLLWQFPAGRIHFNELPASTAERECLEETGIHCIVSKKLGKRIHPDTKAVIFYFLCDYVAGTVVNIDTDENADVLWVAKQNVLQMLTSNVFGPIKELLQ